MKFESSYFDAITCISVIEHIGHDNSIYNIKKDSKSHILDKNLYKKAIIDIIKAKHSNISSKDLEKSIEVTNNFWYDEARDNAKGSDPEDIKVSAKEFADSAIEYYEDALIPPSGEVDDDIDDRFSNFPSKEKSFDHNLQWYLNNSPTLLRHMQPDVKADFLNYAEKSLKPSNASPKEIEDAINIFYKKQFS